MKKFLVKLLCLLAVFALLLPMAGALANDGEFLTRYVKTDNGKGLNLRFDANKNADIIEVLPYGMEVTIIEVNDNATWGHVSMERPNGKGFGDVIDGWVMMSFLSKTKPGKYTPPKKQEPVGTEEEGPSFSDVNTAAKGIKYLEEPYQAVIRTKNPANYVHLRWFPSTEANYIEKYLCNTVVEVIAESKTWAQVRILSEDAPEYVGFILKNNVAALGE